MQATPEEVEQLYSALAERDELLWDRLWAAWRPRVAAWVRRHPQFRYTGEEAQYFVNRAFEKLWRAVDPEKLERFATPSHLIQYLKLCVHSAVLDQLRSPSPGAGAVAAGDAGLDRMADPSPGVEAVAMDRVRRLQLWSIVASHAQSAQEQVLVEAALVRGLPPRTIAARYRGLFGGPQDVYRIKRNLLDRLGRDPRLRDFL